MSFEDSSESFDEKTMTFEFEIDPYDLECPNKTDGKMNITMCDCIVCRNTGELEIITLPAKFEVCHKCNGKGTHVNPAVDGHGISREEFDEDPDFRENYFSGLYDITCQKCDGKRVIPIIDIDRLNDEQKKFYEIVEDRARINAECDRYHTLKG